MSDSAGQYSSPPVGRVKQRGDDGASNTQWSSRDSGEATNGGWTGTGNAPYDQPRAYRDLWDPNAKENDG